MQKLRVIMPVSRNFADFYALLCIGTELGCDEKIMRKQPVTLPLRKGKELQVGGVTIINLAIISGCNGKVGV